MTQSAILLEAEPRDVQYAARLLRKEKKLPGVLYGAGQKNQPITCNYQAFYKAFVHAGTSTIIELKTDGKTIPVLIHETTLDPVSGDFMHVDFYAPDMTKEVTADVQLRIVGESPGVKDFGGILIQHREIVTVSCLPKDLPHDIEVDISLLANLHDSITVADLKLPSTITLDDEPDTLLLVVDAPRLEEAETPPVAASEGAAAPTAEGEAKEGEKKEEK
jgi:large subunit ribosomal protein L25